MNIIIDNIALIGLIFSLVNICVTLYSWYFSRPRLEFYPNDNMFNIYKSSTRTEYGYEKSVCIAFYYIKVSNLSDKPCTISTFTLSACGYDDSESSKRVRIRKKYAISSSVNIAARMCIEMPLILPPLGYAEGFVVFPFGPEYKEDSVSCELTAKTARKNFKTSGFIVRFPNNY
ncbi:MAG: hypothetical protein LIO53_01985 [Oscillospiraceae bacterium]|nr:hypothetical protein [Oscillospiraceae bacterium]